MNVFELLFETIGRGVSSVLVNLITDFAKLVRDLVRAFPDVVKMADLLVRFGTGLVGRAMAIPFEGAAEMLIARLKETGDNARLIRVDDAIRMFMRGPAEIIQEITLTDESGVVGMLLGSAGRFLYRLAKKVRLLNYLIKAKSEAEFVELIVKSWTSKARLLWYVAIVLGGIALLVALSALVSINALCVVWIKGLQKDYILPQDSGFKRSKAPRIVRDNKQTGPDARS